MRSWAEGVWYEGDVASHRGETFQALRDTARQPPHEDWVLIAARGADGASPEVMRTWDPKVDYRRLAVVAMNGGAFIARKDSPGPCPGEDWQLISSPGKRGERGERGEPGARGAPGQGAPTLVRWDVDLKEYSAVPVMSDGTRGPALPVRAFLEQLLTEREGI